jgi:hypothetical protein
MAMERQVLTRSLRDGDAFVVDTSRLRRGSSPPQRVWA